jgi:hypothetical protein
LSALDSVVLERRAMDVTAAPSDDDPAMSAFDVIETFAPYMYLGVRLVSALAVVWFASSVSKYVCRVYVERSLP